MHFNNKHKIVFIICYNLFKYIVIFFELYNILIIFQSFINKTLSFYLDNFCIVYINNILVYSNIETKYKNYINKVFAKFYNVDLYLNINKYVFFVKQVKYLNLIIIIEEIRINLEKIKYILE